MKRQYIYDGPENSTLEGCAPESVSFAPVLHEADLSGNIIVVQFYDGRRVLLRALRLFRHFEGL
jgi:hypothetical protein